MRQRFDDARLPSREEIEELMRETGEELEELAEQGIRRGVDPNPTELELMVERYFAPPTPEEIERQRLLKLQCELDALDGRVRR
jgi:hypothetical protein